MSGLAGPRDSNSYSHVNAYIFQAAFDRLPSEVALYSSRKIQFRGSMANNVPP
jgi:hypothetical protein